MRETLVVDPAPFRFERFGGAVSRAA